ncbi:hypothetical protein QE152_g33183 [Popillia japonica]|uniref:Uncharacterized protein n=1 Tax=Popillia japonica TaxID=7064 RepID=A0AAW1IXM2_POPJA
MDPFKVDDSEPIYVLAELEVELEKAIVIMMLPPGFISGTCLKFPGSLYRILKDQTAENPSRFAAVVSTAMSIRRKSTKKKRKERSSAIVV